jgi:hypothetical protein
MSNVSNKIMLKRALLAAKQTLKAMLHGAIFLATCNAILILRDVN